MNTLVTYGTGFPCATSVAFPADFAPGKPAGLPAAVTNETGDGLVPLRSSLRGTEWAAAQQAAGKQLLYREYHGQPHAECFPGGVVPGSNPAVTTKCWQDVLAVLDSDSAAAEHTEPMSTHL